jgi:hypothetical protein
MDTEPQVDPAEVERLRNVSRGIAGAMREPWEPKAISHAFARRDHMPEARPRLTMQGWIDLDAAESPFLVGENPQFVDLVFALETLGWKAELAEARGDEVTAVRAAEITEQIWMTMQESRSTVVAMSAPEQRSGLSDGDDGFGEWGPVMACLLNELHFDYITALGLDRSKAMALMACLRCNQGWKTRGDNYRLREAVATATA